MLAEKGALFSSQTERSGHGDRATKHMRWGFYNRLQCYTFFHVQCLLSGIFKTTRAAKQTDIWHHFMKKQQQKKRLKINKTKKKRITPPIHIA